MPSLPVLFGVALSIGSALTTFQGLEKYMGVWIALPLTLGVQGTLFWSAQRIVLVPYSAFRRISVIALFSLCFVLSVPFSYLALYSIIEGSSQFAARGENELRRVWAKIYNTISTGRAEKYETELSAARQSDRFLDWKQNYDRTFASLRAVQADLASLSQSEIERAQAISAAELAKNRDALMSVRAQLAAEIESNKTQRETLQSTQVEIETVTLPPGTNPG